MPPPPPTPGAGILYALVARGTVALAEYNCVAGNAPLVALSLLEKASSLGARGLPATAAAAAAAAVSCQEELV